MGPLRPPVSARGPRCARLSNRPAMRTSKLELLGLMGEFDGGCPPRLNEEIADALDDAKLMILQDLKHSLLLEAGEIIAEELKGFIFGLTD